MRARNSPQNSNHAIRLRTLMIVLGLGPPAMAGAWHHPFWLSWIVVGVLMGLGIAAWDEWTVRAILDKRRLEPPIGRPPHKID